MRAVRNASLTTSRNEAAAGYSQMTNVHCTLSNALSHIRHCLALFCMAGLLLRGSPTAGAELFYMDHDLLTSKYVGPVGPLVISGEIEPGDYDRLLKKILDDENRFMAQNKVILASNGGDVEESIKIAGLLQSMFTAVTIGPQTGECVGACFLIYAAAVRRATDAGHLIGLHRPALIDSLSASLSPVEAAALEDRALSQVRAFLAANDVPDGLLAEMFRRSADEVYWLSEQDEKALGYMSPSFHQYLAAKCAWDDAVERGVYAGQRPFADLQQMLACRDRLTQEAARKVLADAVKARSPRDKSGAGKNMAGKNSSH
jgi:hypothetical protein